MSYGEAKVYYDGSHYIAIPHTERPSLKRYIKSNVMVTLVIMKKAHI